MTDVLRELVRKPRVCLDCRTVLGFKERCDISSAHRSISPRTAKGRARWVQRVWGKNLSRARGLMRESVEGPFRLGVLGYRWHLPDESLCTSEVRQFPRGPDVADAWPDEVAGFRGRVVASESIDTPFGRVESVGFGLTLVSHLGGRAAMLRIAQCASFEVVGDDDSRLTVPAGRIRLMGPTGVYRTDFQRMKPWLAGLLEPLDADLPTPLPFDEAHQCWLRDGDIVELHGDLHALEGRRDGTDGSPYRSTTTPAPRVVVRVRVIKR